MLQHNILVCLDLNEVPAVAGSGIRKPMAAVGARCGAGANRRCPVTMPHDLCPWGMFLAADIVVKAVMIGLAFASVAPGRSGSRRPSKLLRERKVRAGLHALSQARTLTDAAPSRASGPVGEFRAAAIAAIAFPRIRLKRTASRSASPRGSSASRRQTRAASRAAPASSPPSARPRPSSACSARSGAS